MCMYMTALFIFVFVLQPQTAHVLEKHAKQKAGRKKTKTTPYYCGAETVGLRQSVITE